MKKVLFCGFGKLGLDCIKEILLQGYDVKLIMSHKQLQPESVDTFAKINGIQYSYKDLRKDKVILKEIQDLHLDYLISVNYKYIISEDVLALANYAINIHGSLLPSYRGRTPHVWSIINGEKTTGVTCHIMDAGVDSGDIIEQIEVKIEEDDTGYTILKKYEKLYPKLLIQSLRHIESKKPFINQNNSQASYFGRRIPEMGYIDFYKSSKDIINFVRAQAKPYPGAYAYMLDGKKIIINKIEKYQKSNLNIKIGVIKNIEGTLVVRCNDSVMRIVDFTFK